MEQEGGPPCVIFQHDSIETTRDLPNPTGCSVQCTWTIGAPRSITLKAAQWYSAGATLRPYLTDLMKVVLPMLTTTETTPVLLKIGGLVEYRGPDSATKLLGVMKGPHQGPVAATEQMLGARQNPEPAVHAEVSKHASPATPLKPGKQVQSVGLLAPWVD